MEFTDTHAHLYADAFDADRDAMMANALAAGVNRIYLPNIDLASIAGMKQLVKDYPAHCFPMMGLHPCSVGADHQEVLAAIREELYAHRDYYCAVGETGTDHYWDKTYAAEQEAAFRAQIGWAQELGKPIIIHSRETLDLNIGIISEYPGITALFHCFNGTAAQAAAIAEMGHYLGIGGVLTYKNAKVDEAIAAVPLELLVLETDAPYLPPVPHRGKRNESAYIPLVAVRLAAARNTTEENIAKITAANAKKIFGN